MAYDCTINGKTFFISHAGITPGWYEQHSDLFDRSFSDTLCANYINQLYFEGALNGVLGEISGYRYGPNKFGSIVWADIYEHTEEQPDLKTDVIQIVGHSQLLDYPLLVRQNYFVYDVDIRQCVYLDSDGDLCFLKTGEKFVFDPRWVKVKSRHNVTTLL